MPFAYEKITDDDWVAYGMEEIDKKFSYWTRRDKYWTRDSERDMYLRYMINGSHDAYKNKTFTFYWHGQLMELFVALNFLGDEIDCLHIEYVLSKRMSGFFIPMPKAMQRRDPALLADIKAALSGYTNRLSLNGKKLDYHVSFNF